MYLSPPVVRRVILLLGPTQVGKSSVANFLINSIVNDGRNKLAVGDGTESCTQQPQCESFTYTYQVNMEEKYAEFSVIDTAGAGDSEEKDPENMVELYKYLLEENIEISCVVLVVRYPTLADRQYKSIINLYKKMLSTALSKKVIVVLTHAEVKNVKWVEKQRRSGRHHEQVIEKIMHSIRTLSELGEFKYYAFDALAAHEDVPEDYQHALECRHKILEDCINSEGFRPAQLSFPKSPRWQESDKVKAKLLKLRGETILLRVNELNMELSSLAKSGSECGERILMLKESISEYKKQIEEFNTDTLVVITKSSLRLGFILFWWVIAAFDIEVEHNIASVTVTQGELSIHHQTGRTVRGTVKGNFFSDLDTTVTIWGHSREVKEKEIKQLEFDVRSKEKDVASDEESLRNITTKASQKENEKREMEQEYQGIQGRISILKADTLTIEQVREFQKDHN